MQVVGQVIGVDLNVEIAKAAGGVYPGSRVTYRQDGKVHEQAFHNNALKFNPQFKTVLESLAPGDTITMVKEKEGEFWNVKSMFKGAVAESVTTSGNGSPAPICAPPPKSTTYPTADERANTQVFIIRQSSLSSAVNLKGNKASVEEVIKTAKQFEAYVLGIPYDDGTIEGMVSSEIN